MDPAEEDQILRAALEQVFEDDPTRRRGSKDEGGGGWSWREDDGNANAGRWVYPTRTGRFWDSNIVPPPS